MAAKRYWRLFVLHNGVNNQFLGIDKIRMAAVPGGPNLATVPANGLASSQQNSGLGGDQCFLATAPNTGTLWQTDVFVNYGRGQWVRYDFGAGNEQEINEIKIAPNWGATNRTPYTMRVQSSDDGVTWSDEWIIYNTAWVIGDFVTFTRPDPIPGAALCWAVYGLQASPPATDPHFELSGLEMRAAMGGPNLCAGGTPIAWMVNDGAAANAFDGNINTYWGGVGYSDVVPAHFIGYIFPAPVTVGYVTMTARNASGFGEFRWLNNQGEIWVSNDGINFLVKAPYSCDPSTAAGQSQSFEIVAGAGAVVTSLFLVGLDFEYEIPNRCVRFGVGLAAMAITPLIIQKGE